MDMIAIDDLVPDILPYVRGCTTNLIRTQILLTATDFCRRTLFSQERMFDLDIQAGDEILPIPSPSIHVEQMYAHSVHVKGRGFIAEINPRVVATWGTSPLRQMENAIANPADLPSAWANVPRIGIRLYPTPGITTLSCLDVRLSYRPTRNASKIDRKLVDDHHQAMTRGTLYRLQNMVGEEWANPQAAAIHDRDYEIEVSNAKVEVNRDFGLATVFIQPLPLA